MCWLSGSCYTYSSIGKPIWVQCWREKETKEMKNTNSFGLSSLSLKAFKFNRNCKLVSAACIWQGRNCDIFMIWIYILEYLRGFWLENIYDIRVDLSDFIQLLSIYIWILQSSFMFLFFMRFFGFFLLTKFFSIYSPVACVSVIRLESSTIAPSNRRAFFNISITTATTRKKPTKFLRDSKTIFLLMEKTCENFVEK